MTGYAASACLSGSRLCKPATNRREAGPCGQVGASGLAEHPAWRQTLWPGSACIAEPPAKQTVGVVCHSHRHPPSHRQALTACSHVTFSAGWPGSFLPSQLVISLLISDLWVAVLPL